MIASKSPDKASGIFKELYYNTSMSCLDLSKRIKKSLPNTTQRLNELIAKGAVAENGYAPSTGGRKPLMYSLTGDFMFTLAVAVDQFVVRMVLMDMQREIVPIATWDIGAIRRSGSMRLRRCAAPNRFAC